MNIRPLTYIFALLSFQSFTQTVLEGCWNALYYDGSGIDSSKSAISIKDMSFVNSSDGFLLSYDKTNSNRTVTPTVSRYNQNGRLYFSGDLPNTINFDTYLYPEYRHVHGSFDDFMISGRGTVRTISYKDYGIGEFVPSFAYFYAPTNTNEKFAPYIASDFYNKNYYRAYKRGDSVVVDYDNISRVNPPIFKGISYNEFDFAVTDPAGLESLPTYHVLATSSRGVIEVFTLSASGKIYLQQTHTIDIANEKFKLISYKDNIGYILARSANILKLYKVNFKDYSIQEVQTAIPTLLSPNFDFEMLSQGVIGIAYTTSGKANVLLYNIERNSFSLLQEKEAKLNTTSHIAVSMNFNSQITLAHETNKVVSFFYFTPAPNLPKPIIQSLYMNYGPTIHSVKKTGNVYAYCGEIDGEWSKNFKFANLSAGIDAVKLVDSSRHTNVIFDRAQFGQYFSDNLFTVNNLYGTSYRLMYLNACGASDSVSFKIVGQSFSLTETSNIAAAYCQNATSNISIATKAVWPIVGYNQETPTVDTMVLIYGAPSKTLKYPNTNTLPISQVPYEALTSSSSYKVFKTATTPYGCSVATVAKTFTLFKSPDASSISLRRAVSKRLILPSVSGSISDTLQYFPWDNRTLAIGLLPTFDNSLNMLGKLSIGSIDIDLVSGESRVFMQDTSLASLSNSRQKVMDIQFRNFNSLFTGNFACGTNVLYRFLLKKITFADLDLNIIGDASIKPGNLYSYGIYSNDISNRLAGGNYRFRWRVYQSTNLNTPVAKRIVELTDTLTTTNTTKLLGKVNGKYVLQADIYAVHNGIEKWIGKLARNIEVKSSQVIVTENGSTIDPNRLGSDPCKQDTFMCSGLYIKSLSFSNLSHNRGTCTITPTVDNTSDSTKFIKVFTGENYQFFLSVGDEYSTSDEDSAKIIVSIDYDNDGQVGEEGESIVSSFFPISQLSVIRNIPNLPENIGDKRMSIILTKTEQEINNKTNICELLESGEVTVKEDFLIHIEVPAQLMVSNFVSPNGDGKNDYFEIKGIDERYDTKLKVFNKFGINVYEKDNFGKDDYKSDGFERNLRPDTYYYMFENGSTTTKGFFEIK